MSAESPIKVGQHYRVIANSQQAHRRNDPTTPWKPGDVIVIHGDDEYTEKDVAYVGPQLRYRMSYQGCGDTNAIAMSELELLHCVPDGKPAAIRTCTCTNRQIFEGGCVCGHLQKGNP